jgi:activator of 2-hydroxyglutaryl-CoA dehydratase
MRRPSSEGRAISFGINALQRSARKDRHMKKKNSGFVGLKESIKAAAEQKKKRKEKKRAEQITIGVDLGDKTSWYCVLDNEGEVIKKGSVATTKKGIEETFGGLERCLIALEVGEHTRRG